MKDINKNLESDITTAKEIVNTTIPYVNDYWGNREYHVGKVSMILDKKGEGRVTISYVDKKDPPNVVNVYIDSKQKKILNLRSLNREDKADPGEINIYEWTVDSDLAIDITKELFKSETNFEIDKILAQTNNNFIKSPEVWEIKLINTKDKMTYWSTIDPYSGEVIGSGGKTTKLLI
ncbi:MAG: PepSY domain-containing protein [Paenibacillaceae bacterium]